MSKKYSKHTSLILIISQSNVSARDIDPSCGAIFPYLKPNGKHKSRKHWDSPYKI